MCGIVADYGEPDTPAVERMLDRVAHRGPDDEGAVRVNGHCWLGHRRLSIVDLEGGAQPLVNPAGDLWLVGNGEIYNHEVVRGALDDTTFATSSDNEVALALLEAEGPEGLGALEGMFAFVSAGEDGRFVAARDPVGIKPLYWARRDGRVRFASEMGAYDAEWLPEVHVFPPGCYWTPEGGLTRFATAVTAPAGGAVPAWDPDGDIPQEVLTRTREVLVRAVEGQLMGDVPVGVFLSGGLDSCLVAAIAARAYARRGQRLQTFAVGLVDSPDLIAARTAAEHLGAEHRERVYTAEEALEAVPGVVRTIESFDPSLVRSAVPNYFLAELASRHVKVVLTGEGADELFAGYDYLRDFPDPDRLHDELVRIVEGLHNLNLQRCDRVTMAHGLEARVPFLDSDVIALGMSLPGESKLAGEGRPEKRLLREAFAGWLPDALLWRRKAEFGDGSGASSVLSDRLESGVSDDDLADGRGAVRPPLRTKEELTYHRIFSAHLPGVRPERTIGRCATA